jgi:PRC-barrel domain
MVVPSLTFCIPASKGLTKEETGMPTRQGTATTVDDRRETVSLIGSDKVEGTSVYGADDRKIGTVQRVMIDKISGYNFNAAVACFIVFSFQLFRDLCRRTYAQSHWLSLRTSRDPTP